MTSVGTMLRQARAIAGLKQSDVAAELDCAATSLTNWENDKVQPSFEILSKLCQVYGISPLSLLNKEYKYADIVEIADKPIVERTYEEQIALNFSGAILKRSMTSADSLAATEADEMADFILDLELVDRFSERLKPEEMFALKEEYDANGDADIDILFAYHILSSDCKAAFLSMLSGLIVEDDNLQPFSKYVGFAANYTYNNLVNERKRVKGSKHQKGR